MTGQSVLFIFECTVQYITKYEHYLMTECIKYLSTNEIVQKYRRVTFIIHIISLIFKNLAPKNLAELLV